LNLEIKIIIKSFTQADDHPVPSTLATMGTLHDHGHTVNLTALLDSTQVSLAASTPVRLTSSDSILALISSRYKRDEPSTWLGDSTLVSLNPFQVLASASEASQKDYRQRAYNISAGSLTEGHPARLQPHPYELACRVYLTMKRTGESQSVVFRCVPIHDGGMLQLTIVVLSSGLSGSGASTQLSLFTSQLLLLSSYTKKDSRVADQVAALETVLSSFGCAKTVVNPNASRHSTFTELHFSHSGRLAGAKVLAFGLDKTRTWKLGREERTFHAFYQLLAGATHEERAELGLLDDVTSYGLLASSGTYRLPAGPRSNDSIELDNLRGALKVLGFKPRHISSIFRLLSAILLLSNLEFADRGDRDLSSESAWITNHDVLDRVSSLLGVMPEDLERGLTNRVRYVRKEMCAVLLKSEGAAKQRDTLMSSLYSILFAFVVETCNHKLFPGDEAIAALQKAGGSSILTLDAPGFHSLVPSRPGVTQIALIHALNSFTEFTNNYTSSLVQFWLAEHQFDGDAGIAARAQEDGVRMKDVVPPSDESARMELLRGGRVGGKADRKPGGVLGGMSKTCANVRKGILMSTTDEADDELLRGMRDHFGAHTAFVSTPAGPGGRHAFGIQHWAGTVAYDVTNFVESDLDAVDPEFVALLRGSDDGFVAKLFSGPSMAAETHPLDDRTIVAAQVSSMPLRRPSSVVPLSSFPPTDVDYTLPFIDPLAIHPRSSQLNATIAGLLNLLERTKIWQVISLRPNDTLSPGMIDTSRLKHQIAAFHLPELIARKQIDYIYDHAVGSFAARHGVDVTPGREQDSVSAFLRGVGLKESDDFALGIKRVWLSYAAWKLVEDRLRSGEPEETRVAKESSEERSGDIVESLSLKAEEAGEWAEGEYKGTDSVDDLLMKSRSESGAAPSTPFGDGGYHATLHSQQQQQHQAFQQQQHLQNQDYLSYPGAAAPYIQASRVQSDVWGGLAPPPAFNYQHPAIDHRVLDADGIPRESAGATVEEIPASRGRRIWVAMVWSLTWWIPSITLKYLGRMKRPDVRMAWREKVALCMLIGFFCGVVIFCTFPFPIVSSNVLTRRS
jgi:chitin synthase